MAEGRPKDGVDLRWLKEMNPGSEQLFPDPEIYKKKD
jgi:hypothetical protein